MNDRDMRQLMARTKRSNLNELSAAQNCLILLRILYTSDLTFMYMLLAPETVKDICREVKGIFATEEQWETETLTPQQKDEAIHYLKNMEAYYA